MMDLNANEAQALQSDGVKLGVFFRLETDPIIRLWAGVGHVEVGVTAYDTGGAVYKGLGQLLNVPVVQQLINGVADRIVFQVSGVSDDILALASTEVSVTVGRACQLGVGFFSNTWAMLGVPKWLFWGTADQINLEEIPGEEIVRSINLSVGSPMTGRRRRGYTYLTDHDQQGRFPGDRACERTVLYAQGVEKRWPVPT